MYLAKPDWYTFVYKKFTNAVNNAVSNSNSDADPVGTDQKHAKFVNLDGKVQVKKVNSVQWVEADYRTVLDKGDLVQTGADANARITFGEHTTYMVMRYTLVSVEENSTESIKPSSVAVQINHGAVDLATPNWSQPDSKAAVSVEDATAQLHSNSRAAVKSDPETKSSEIMVSSGSAQVRRGGEKIDLAPWEKITDPNGGPAETVNMMVSSAFVPALDPPA